MIDDLKEIIEQYKDFVECETATARVLRNIGNENGARDYEETAKNDKRIVALLTELQERREADRWIPVSERLPKPPKPNDDIYNIHCSDFVLVCIEWWNGQKVIEIASYNFDDEEWDYHGSEESEVVAWRSLPKPYESEDK